MVLALERTIANEIFFRAFQDGVHSIVRNLENDITKREASQAIQRISQQLNGDYSRLTYLNDVIQVRVWEDETWAISVAGNVYELLAKSLDLNLTITNLPRRGP